MNPEINIKYTNFKLKVFPQNLLKLFNSHVQLTRSAYTKLKMKPTCSSKHIFIAGGSRSRTQKYSFQSDWSYCLDRSPGSSPKTDRSVQLSQRKQPSTLITRFALV